MTDLKVAGLASKTKVAGSCYCLGPKRSWTALVGDEPRHDDASARHALELASRWLHVYPVWIYNKASMTRSTVFTSNRSQAVRLPKAVAFPADVHQVEIVKVGRSRVISPRGKRWDDLFESGPRASEDFMSGREQPAAEDRETF